MTAPTSVTSDNKDQLLLLQQSVLTEEPFCECEPGFFGASCEQHVETQLTALWIVLSVVSVLLLAGVAYVIWRRHLLATAPLPTDQYFDPVKKDVFFGMFRT